MAQTFLFEEDFCVGVTGLYKYHTTAVGGTFDHIHLGHKALLRRAFETSQIVVIGLTSDTYAASEGKKIEHDFEFRKAQLTKFLGAAYPRRKYLITKLESKFGAGIFTKDIEAIVVSTETLPSVKSANLKRAQSGIPEMKVEVVPMIVAKDGSRISSTRIRAGEMDEEGNLK